MPSLPKPSEPETPLLADLAAILAISAEASEPRQVLIAVDALSRKVLRHRVCSIFRYLDATQDVERIYTSSPGSHPVGGRKRIADYPHNQAVLARGEIYVAPDREAVARTYKDPERIFALGVTSIMNVPVRHAGRNLGALNLFGEAGWYGADVFPAARTVAGLLVPVLLAWRT